MDPEMIPIYQRTYSWTDKECRQLWSDILPYAVSWRLQLRRRAFVGQR
jgi:hypothetical protein